MRLAFLFTLVGYGTKTGLAPFHTWLPDAHSQAPSPVSAVLSGATLALSLYALARFHLVASSVLGPDFSVDATRGLRPAQLGGGPAVHRRPGRPQAAARVFEHRAHGSGRARARLWRAYRTRGACPAPARARTDQGAASSWRAAGSSNPVAVGGSRGCAGALTPPRSKVERSWAGRSSCRACRHRRCSFRRSPSCSVGSRSDGDGRQGWRPCSSPSP